MKKKSVLCVFIVALMIWMSIPSSATAFPGSKLPKKVGQCVGMTAKGIGKTIYWTVKGSYIVVEYLVIEAFRPLTAVTDKMVDIWGVPVEK